MVSTVVTTSVGCAATWPGDRVRGLRPWQSTVLRAADRPTLTVTATPCRHGPPLSRPVAGAVVGFVIAVEGSEGAIWMTGDTVLYRGLRSVPQRLTIDTMLVHTGRVRFPITGPLTFSMGGAEAIELALAAQPRVVVPVHFDGWSHFSEQRGELRAALAHAPPSLAERILWLTPGQATTVADPPATPRPTLDSGQ